MCCSARCPARLRQRTTLSVTDSGTSPFLFTGEQRDSETSLYYLRARYYDPETGRFLARDPVTGFAGLPSSQNPYAYVSNNLVNLHGRKPGL